MGYTHYWYRTKTFTPAKFKAVVADFQKTLSVLEHLGVKLAGGGGEGQPIITNEEIRFNGLEKCGHVQRDLGITWPSDKAQGVAPLILQHRNGNDSKANVDGNWFAGLTLDARTCGGDCSHETFLLTKSIRSHLGTPNEPQANGKYFDFCKTAYKPYDLAVNITLIIAKHHLGEQIVVSSDGELAQWKDSMTICQHFLGYGADFKLKGDLEE